MLSTVDKFFFLSLSSHNTDVRAFRITEQEQEKPLFAIANQEDGKD
jgi:hypothetical protein